jgi:tripartite-type tricarboxylate transporter receptor subunit TctC
VFKRSLTFVLLAAASMTEATAAQRDAFPGRPVRLIVSNTPGSAPDVIARLLGAKLTESWNQQVVVDNRPGATGLIAAETVAKAAPDGYTFWLNTMTQLISTLQAQRHLLAKDFAAVSLVASTPFVIVVSGSVPVKSLTEWITYAKARPGQLVYGSAGQWGSSHLCLESLNAIAGIQMTHVPYKGSTLVLNDLVAGRIHAYCPAAPSLPAFAQGGKVRALAVTYQKPTPLAPGVPPVADTIPGFELLGWYGLQAPLATPKQLIARINADVVKALKTQELQERLFAVGAEAVGSTPADFATFLQKETARWEKVLREGGTIPVNRN